MRDGGSDERHRISPLIIPRYREPPPHTFILPVPCDVSDAPLGFTALFQPLPDGGIFTHYKPDMSSAYGHTLVAASNIRSALSAISFSRHSSLGL